MATLQQIIDSFDNYVESANGLGITCIKGFPDFRQPGIDAPLAALLYAGSGKGAGEVAKRVGGPAKAVVLTMQVYATDEVNLFALAEKLQTMRDHSPITLTAATEKVKTYIGDDERLEPGPDEPKETRHVTQCRVVLMYE